MYHALRDRFIWAILGVVAATTGYLLRDDTPDRVSAKVNEAFAIYGEARERDLRLLETHAAGELDLPVFAASVETEVLPLLEKAERLLAECRAENVKGEAFDSFEAVVKMRLEGWRLTCRSAWEHDARLFAEGQAKLAQSLVLEKRFAPPEPTDPLAWPLTPR